MATPGYEPLSDEQLETWLEDWPVLGLATGGQVRLSLAGAQDKLCLFPRFDRAPGPESGLVRLHQEDFCQALGLPPQRKYQQEGGPSFATCFDLVAREIPEPMPALAALIDWLIFCLLSGNADGHGKNLALLRPADGALCLAPFYDLVCTRAYPRLDRRLAMTIGGQADPGVVADGDWQKQAAEVGISGRFLRGRVRDLAGKLKQAIDPVSRDFRARFGDSPVIQMISPLIRNQIRRTLGLLG